MYIYQLRTTISCQDFLEQCTQDETRVFPMLQVTSRPDMDFNEGLKFRKKLVISPLSITNPFISVNLLDFVVRLPP